jgi:hypothetical protein
MKISTRGATIVGGAVLALFTAMPAAGAVTLTAQQTALPTHAVTAAPPAKKCPANMTSGTIGGQTKCLQAGQQCQQAHAADYTKFGFTCGKNGTKYTLTKKGAPTKPTTPAKPPAKH